MKPTIYTHRNGLINTKIFLPLPLTIVEVVWLYIILWHIVDNHIQHCPQEEGDKLKYFFSRKWESVPCILARIVYKTVNDQMFQNKMSTSLNKYDEFRSSVT